MQSGNPHLGMKSVTRHLSSMCSCSTPCWISFYPSWELVYYYQNVSFSFTRGQRYVINLQVTKWPWWSWGMCCWCRAAGTSLFFLTCNNLLIVSVAAFLNFGFHHWFENLWFIVAGPLWPKPVYLLSQIWQQWFGSNILSPLVQQPDESTVAPLSNHVLCFI